MNGCFKNLSGRVKSCFHCQTCQRPHYHTGSNHNQVILVCIFSTQVVILPNGKTFGNILTCTQRERARKYHFHVSGRVMDSIHKYCHVLQTLWLQDYGHGNWQVVLDLVLGGPAYSFVPLFLALGFYLALWFSFVAVKKVPMVQMGSLTEQGPEDPLDPQFTDTRKKSITSRSHRQPPFCRCHHMLWKVWEIEKWNIVSVQPWIGWSTWLTSKMLCRPRYVYQQFNKYFRIMA